MATQFYIRNQVKPTLLRRANYVDEAFIDGKWVPTKAIVDYMFGHDDFVEPITDAAARSTFPGVLVD